MYHLGWQTIHERSGAVSETSFAGFKLRSWEVKEFILPRVPFSCVAVPHEERCQVFGFAALHDFMCHDEGLVFSHSFWGQPTQFFMQARDAVKFAAPEDDSGGKVQNFLELVEIFLSPVTVDCEAVVDSGHH